VSVLLLLYIFNGLVDKEREKSTQEPADDPFSDEQNDSSDEVEDQNSLQAE